MIETQAPLLTVAKTQLFPSNNPLRLETLIWGENMYAYMHTVLFDTFGTFITASIFIISLYYLSDILSQSFKHLFLCIWKWIHYGINISISFAISFYCSINFPGASPQMPQGHLSPIPYQSIAFLICQHNFPLPAVSRFFLYSFSCTQQLYTLL